MIAALQRWLRWLLAPACLICGVASEREICGACQADFRPLRGAGCSMCQEPMRHAGTCARCRRRPPLFDRVVCAFEHRGSIRDALHRLKFQRRRRLAEPLGHWLAEAWAAHDGQPAVVVPVPLHAGRYRERGFNQAHLLARPLCQAARLPLRPELLRRIQATGHQFQHAAGARAANVGTAFRAGAVEGLDILLVDDIMTTGATLNACAAALRLAGARTVRAITLTRTVSHARRPVLGREEVA